MAFLSCTNDNEDTASKSNLSSNDTQANSRGGR